MDDLEMLTAEQVSELLQIPETTLAQWRHRGQGPAFVKLERLVRYRRADIMQYIASGSGKVS